MSFLDPKPITAAGLDAATAAKVNTPGSATATALSATILDQIETPIADAVAPKLDAATAALTYTTPTNAVLAAADAAVQRLVYKTQATGAVTWSDANGWKVFAMSADGKQLIGIKDNTAPTCDLGYSTDDGATWTVAETMALTIRGVLYLANGEVMVTTQNGGSRHYTWVSTGWAANPVTATWNNSRTSSFTTLSSYAVQEYQGLTRDSAGHVWTADYGKKTNAGGTPDPQTAAIRIMRSDNHGVTWTEAFNLATWLTTVRGKSDLTTVGYHLHGVAWDPYWSRLWATYGDYVNTTTGEAGIIYSDDFGTTWNIAWTTVGAENRFQTVGITPMENAIVLHPDGNPASVYRIPRTGYRTMAAPEAVLSISATNSQAIAGMGFRAAYAGAPLIMAVTQQAAGGTLSRLVATADGQRFYNLYLDTAPPTVTNFGNLFYVVGPTASGKVLATSIQDGRYALGISRLTVPVTI